MTWSVFSGSATVNPGTGLVTVTGTGQIQIRVESGGKFKDITLTGVNPPSVLTTVILTTPGNATQYTTDTSVQVVASGKDQFNAPLALTNPVVWSITGSATINSAGLITFDSTPGTVTVTATSNGKFGSLVLTSVAPIAPTLTMSFEMVSTTTSVTVTAGGWVDLRLVFSDGVTRGAVVSFSSPEAASVSALTSDTLRVMGLDPSTSTNTFTGTDVTVTAMVAGIPQATFVVHVAGSRGAWEGYWYIRKDVAIGMFGGSTPNFAGDATSWTFVGSREVSIPGANNQPVVYLTNADRLSSIRVGTKTRWNLNIGGSVGTWRPDSENHPVSQDVVQDFNGNWGFEHYPN